MTAQTSASVPTTSLLKNAMMGNGIFSAASGTAMLLAGKVIANFIGLPSAAPLTVIGAGLLFFALMLFYSAAKNPIPKITAWLAVEGDLLWVILSAVVVFANPFGLTVPGRWLVAIIADIVLLFAILQFVGIRRQSG